MAERRQAQQTGSQQRSSDMAQTRQVTPTAALNNIIELAEQMSQLTMHVVSGDEAAILGMHIQQTKAQAEHMIAALREAEVSTGESEDDEEKDE